MRSCSMFGGFSGTRASVSSGLTLLVVLTFGGPAGAATVTLADQPIFATADVPGNMAFTLSVEFPTALSVANIGNYSDATTYTGGYFDPAKCYTYQYNVATPSSSYFQPTAFASGTNGHSCSGAWSGNFMNWAATPTIDPFRWALTGGYRSLDLPAANQTILEKAWATTQAGTANFPYKGTTQPTGANLAATLISSVTPFTHWSNFTGAIPGNGNMMAIMGGTTGMDPNAFNADVYDLPTNLNVAATTAATKTGVTPNSASNPTTYRIYIRVSVCDTSVLGTAGLESNCKGYGTATTSGTGVTTYSIYKPEGLIQQYANKIRYSVFGYLDGLGIYDQGGVLREPMEFVGPTYPTPLSATVTTNPTAEWSSSTGVMLTNPDPTTAAASGVSQSGVMNYLNRFGETSHLYETYDNVSELYYAAIRYYENLGNVPEWLANVSPTTLDGFPAVSTWTDPILYSCQKNFVLGIGDDHTWTDYNVGGAALAGNGAVAARPVPAAVAADGFNKASTWLSALQTLEGITPTDWWNQSMGSTQYIAGLAYGAHVLDIRPDLTGTQTVDTYWMDVAEYQEVENLNNYYLATKYGGFNVPQGYSITNTTPLPTAEYDTTGNTIVMNGGNVHNLPDNYFEANNAANMVASLQAAFQNIANAIKAYTTSFSLSSPTVSTSGELSFASQYDSSAWTSVLTANQLTFSTTGVPTTSPLWQTSTTLQAQLAGTGWQAPSRNIATWNGTAGVPFEVANLTASQLAALLPSYSTTTTSTQYLQYLRGSQANEVGSTVTGSSRSLRARSLLLGDIIDANLAAVAVPIMSYSETHNPGYAAFKSTWAARPTMVYAAANDGMVHGFVGTTGTEQFAYIPSGTFQGPTATPQVSGLAALGNPNFTHHYYVDATPRTFDLDLGHTGGTIGTPNWRTLLIGGLGKGGQSYYALDVTNPAGMNTESAVAGAVKWEFTDPTMGYSYGAPLVVKTAKYGWVVALTSGYNNSDGYGYLYLVNPATGALLQKIKTPNPSNGLTQASAYVQDYTDYTADSIYVGDLEGQLWRFNLTGTPSSYPAPTQIAALTDSLGNPQPVTTAPLIEIHPTTRKRYVLVGTGQLLSSNDVGSTAMQTFYAIIDGTAGAFNTDATPITRSDLTPVTNVTASTPIPASSMGWYLDLGTSWRMVTNPVAYNGIVVFAALEASTNVCSPSGQSDLYALNYASGLSVLTSSTGTPAVNVPYSNAVTNIAIVNTNSNTTNSSTEIVVGDNKENLSSPPANLYSTLATRILNWREIPTTQ